ncbi:N-acetylneuraminate synthase family protein [Solirubrobacter soli]|uniref:N-acetylneuraminate synthase family protein n=1 Tax=Solirubrobacter soli TaxID=363832 RepID=UPI00069E75A4|nr:N-acetylneuraminate synthase family protein [Solirubrobacter soli]
MPDQFDNPRALRLNDFEISDTSDCYVIAEIGHNHGGSLDSAHELFAEAKAAGAHAVKLQKRDNRSLYTREGYNKPYENENSYGATYGEHREYLEFGKAEYEDLIAHSKEIGVTFFSTAFDIPSADFLAELDMPLYKIASADLINTPLLKHVAKIGKPMILSTGGATLEDVKRGYSTVAEINPEVALLQCTAGYPAAWEELDLRVISTYRDLFPDAVVGLSSHDNGIAMAVAAYVLGGRIVEKHFTLNRALKGTDHRFSLEPQGLRKLVRDLKRTRVALGDGNKSMYPSETEPIIKMAKKLVAARPLPAGHTLTEADIAFKSPGDGLPPYELDRVLGRTLTHPVMEDGALTFEVLEPADEQVGSTTHGD